MTASDTFRASALAQEVLRALHRDYPERLIRLRKLAPTLFEADGSSFDLTAVRDWCRDQQLDSLEVVAAASMWLLKRSSGEALPPVDESRPEEELDYVIPWRPGESKSQFQIRALAEFERRAKDDGQFTSDAINSLMALYVECFVRFQVGGEKYDRIAKAVKKDRRDVRRKIAEIAKALDVQLRASPAGNPDAKRTKRDAIHIVRRPRTR